MLVTGALGGVGRTAVHVARKHGARVLAGVRAKEKEDASKLNVDGVVAIDSEEEIEHLHDLDAIADTVGGTTIQRLLKTIRKAASSAQFSANRRVPRNTTSASRRLWCSRTPHDFINWLTMLPAMNSRFRLLAP